MSDHPKIHFDLPTGVQATDLTQVFTSKPYPVVVIEAATFRVGVPEFGIAPSSVEAAALSAGLTSIQLRDIFNETDTLEAATFSTDLTSIHLEQVIQFGEFTADPEAATFSTNLTSIHLERVIGFVEHTADPEAATLSTNITSIHLE